MGWVTPDHPTTDELNACVQCGLCLPACPTFRLTGRETASPRGRIQAMKAVHNGVLELDGPFQGVIDFCLGCRACEPVCPGMVPYGRALEGTRAEIAVQRPTYGHRLRSFLLGTAIGSRRSLRFGSGALRIAQATGITSLSPARYRRLSDGLRPLGRRPGPTLGHEGGSGISGAIALLAGCIQDEWFRPVNHAAIELLEMAGFRVEVPGGQTCCGALAAHDGKADAARALAKRNMPVLSGYDQVVVTSAGCSAHVREYGHWAEGGDEVGDRAIDVTVAVARAIEAGLLPALSGGSGTMAIQDPCHLRHAQRVTLEPRRILEAGGYQLVEIDPAGMCCGAAGLYTVLQPEASQELGNRKAAQIRSNGGSRVASANPGCEMQLRASLGRDYEIAHPIEWYLRALTAAGPTGRVAAVKAVR
jgi:glycolate oxidase iron-sulfur subunit